MQNDYQDIFISYRRVDIADADRIYKALKVAGFSVFMDQKKIQPGHNWPEKLRSHVGNCKYFLLVVTQNTFAPERFNPTIKRENGKLNVIDWVWKEILIALDVLKVEKDGVERLLDFRNDKDKQEYNNQNDNKVIIPLFIRDNYFPTLTSLSEWEKEYFGLLTENHGISFPTSDVYFDKAIKKLIEVIIGKGLTDGLFDWNKLKEKSRTISKKYLDNYIMGREDIVIRRESVFQKFQTFLDSKTCVFPIVGESASGKTFFLIDLENEYHNDDSFCFFFIPAGHIDQEKSIEENLKNEFFWDLSPIQTNWDFWKIIKNIKEIWETHITFVLCIDGIDKSPDSTALKKRIDELAKTAPEWMKIVLTLTPRLWDNLIHEKFELPVNYFLLNDNLQGRVEPVKLDMFTAQETEEAYERYKEKFNLQDDFHRLDFKTQERLSKPHILDLVAKICEGRGGINDATFQSFITPYIESLQDKTIGKRAIEFVEQLLIPLMFKEGHYKTSVTTEELIANNNNNLDIQNSINFLKNNRIIIAYQLSTSAKYDGQNYEYYFSVDEYYDHFAGRYLFEQYQESKSNNNGLNNIKALIQEINQTFFLFGPVKNLLYFIIRSEPNSSDLIREIANDKQQHSQNFIIDVLIDFCSYHSKLIEQVLNDWSETWNTPVFKKHDCNWQLVAVEIAACIGNTEILRKALKSKHIVIRERAVTITYRACCKDKSFFLNVVEPLVNSIRLSTLFFERQVLESCLALSALFLCKQKEDYTRTELLSLWKPALNRITFQFFSNKKLLVILEPVRKSVLFLLIKVALSLLRSIPGRYDLINMRELNQYYKLPEEIKKKVEELTFILDKGGSGNKFQVILDSLFNAKVDGKPLNNMLVKLIIDYTFISEGLREQHQSADNRFDETLAIIKKFSEEEFALTTQQKRIMWDLSWVYASMLFIQKENYINEEYIDNIFKDYESYIWACFKDVQTWVGSLGVYAYLGYSDYARVYHQHYRNIRVELLNEFLNWAFFIERDYQRVRDVLEEMTYLAASELWQMSLFSMKDIVKDVLSVSSSLMSVMGEDKFLLEDIREKTLEILALTNLQAPRAVRAYLSDRGLDDYYQEVSIIKFTEGVAGISLKGGLGMWTQFLLSAAFTEEGREHLYWVAHTACTSSSLSVFWSELGIRFLDIIQGIDD